MPSRPPMTSRDATLLADVVGHSLDVADRDDAHQSPVVGDGNGAPIAGQQVVGRRARQPRCPAARLRRPVARRRPPDLATVSFRRRSARRSTMRRCAGTRRWPPARRRPPGCRRRTIRMPTTEHAVGDQLAAERGPIGRAALAAGRAPQDRPQDAAAVEREAGNQVEDAEQQVDREEVARHDVDARLVDERRHRDRRSPASTKLVSGPTTAIRNSVVADLASPARFETPPKMNSVIELACRPLARATNE